MTYSYKKLNDDSGGGGGSSGSGAQTLSPLTDFF